MSGPDREINAGAPPDRRRPLRAFLLASATLLAVDQATKAVARVALHPEVRRPLFGTPVSLTLTHNLGSAFGLPVPGWLLIVVGAVVSLAILWYVGMGRGMVRHPGLALSFGMIFGGSIGNLIDRVTVGAVVDFIDLRVWPVFNVADIAITVGFVLLAAQLLRGR